MSTYDATTYGERIAEVYDDWYATADPSMIDMLASLAGAGPALELGIGSGRVALPLRERGVTVHGVDASPKMVERLRAKPGGAEIPVALGDFAEFQLAERFSLVYVPFNTFFGLLSQEDQVRCFQCVARHLADDGVFLMEVFVPDLGRFDRGQRVNLNRSQSDGVILDTSVHDPVSQRVDSHHIHFTEAGTRIYPVRVRYAFPPELDLMARLAGLTLRERWSGWNREPFSKESVRHVSVYGKHPKDEG
jgi:SAM-dependent methyltransferase